MSRPKKQIEDDLQECLNRILSDQSLRRSYFKFVRDWSDGWSVIMGHWPERIKKNPTPIKQVLDLYVESGKLVCDRFTIYLAYRPMKGSEDYWRARLAISRI